MATAKTVKGQVTIPKKGRDTLQLRPGDGVDFNVNRQGEEVVHKAGVHKAGVHRAGVHKAGGVVGSGLMG